MQTHLETKPQQNRSDNFHTATQKAKNNEAPNRTNDNVDSRNSRLRNMDLQHIAETASSDEICKICMAFIGCSRHSTRCCNDVNTPQNG